MFWFRYGSEYWSTNHEWKSGSNDFHGSYYFSERNEDNIGEDSDGVDYPQFDEEINVKIVSPNLV